MSTKAHLTISSALAIALFTSGHVVGQGTCADLNITSLTYAAFNDSSIEVIAHTNPDTFFSYPTFALVNALGDTLTHENVNFFGITSNDQTHSSFLVDGQAMPSSPFIGTLVFTYMGLESTETCVYPIDGSLCPPAPCSALSIFIYNTGTGVDATFDWSMTDDGGTVVDNGTLELGAATATDGDSLCLPAGAYTLHMDQVSGPAGAYQFGATRGFPFDSGPHSIFFQSQPNDLPFTFFDLCVEGSNAVDELSGQGPSITVLDHSVTITSADGSALEHVDVLDASGHVVHRLGTNTDRALIDLHSQPAGLYLVRVASGASIGKVPFTQRIILL